MTQRYKFLASLSLSCSVYKLKSTVISLAFPLYVHSASESPEIHLNQTEQLIFCTLILFFQETDLFSEGSPFASPSVGFANPKQVFGVLRILMNHDTTVDQMTVTILDMTPSTKDSPLRDFGSACRVSMMVLPDKKFKFKTSIAKGKHSFQWKKSFTFYSGNQVTIFR